MATQKEIRVGSIVRSSMTLSQDVGIVIAIPSKQLYANSPASGDIYWFSSKEMRADYIQCLIVVKE